MNVASIFRDCQRCAPVVRFHAGCLNGVPSALKLRLANVVVVLPLATPSGDENAALPAAQVRIAAWIGQNRFVNFTPNITCTTGCLSDQREKLRGKLRPLVFLDSPEESDSSVWGVVDRVTVVGVRMDHIYVFVGLHVEKYRRCRAINLGLVNIVLLASIIICMPGLISTAALIAMEIGR